MSKTIVAQRWEERERGWGRRPDGWSIHITSEDHKKFVDIHWGQRPKGPTPAEYSCPDGDPILKEVDEALYKQIADSDCGIWVRSIRPPKKAELVKEEKPEELKLTPFQWCEALGANPTDIKDPDGWRHRNIQFHTPLTRDEFLECASESTISLGRNSVLCYAIKQWENNRNR